MTRILAASDDAQKNVDTFLRLQQEIIVGGNFDLIPTVFSKDFKTLRSGFYDLTTAAGGSYPAGDDAHVTFRQGVTWMLTTLSGQQRDFHEILAVGDTLVARWTLHGKHTGTFVGVEPTGRDVTWTEVAVVRFNDEHLLIEGWFMSDEVNVAAQIGLTLTPATADA